MDLDYYLWKNKITTKSLAKKIGVAESTIYHIVRMKVSPHLLTAVKIVMETQGEVAFIDLLGLKDREKFLERMEMKSAKETQTAGK